MLALHLASALVGYTLACVGFGSLTGRLLGRDASEPSLSPVARLALDALLGEATLAGMWLLLALGGWFRPWIVIPLLALGGAFGMAAAGRELRGLAAQLYGHYAALRADSRVWQVIAGFTLVFALLGATSLARKPSGDALFFHMLVPKVMAASHRLDILRHMDPTMVSLGLQGEMHYAALMLLGSADAAQLFSWPTLLMGAAVFASLCGMAGLARRGRVLALAALFTSTAVLSWIGEGKVELFPAALGLGAFHSALRYVVAGTARSLRLTGLLTGAALLGKLSYALTLAPGIVVLVVWPHCRGWISAKGNVGSGHVKAPNRTLAGVLALLGAWVLVALAPNIIKNAVFLGNALAPLSLDGSYFHWVQERWYGPEITRRTQLTYPFILTFGTYFGQYGNLSPLVLAFLPLVVLLAKRPRVRATPLAVLSVATLVNLVPYVMIHPDKVATRYFLTTLLLCIAPAARAAELAASERPRTLMATAVPLCVVIVCVSVLNASLGVFFLPSASFARLLGRLPECAKAYGWCEAALPVNVDAAAGDRVFSTSAFKYYLRADLIQCSSRNEDAAVVSVRAGESLWLALHERRFRYVLLDGSGQVHPALRAALAAPPPWAKVVPLWEGREEGAYRLEFHNAPGPQSISCEEVQPSSWDVVRKAPLREITVR